VLLGVHLVIVAHVAHWLGSGTTLSPLEPSEAMEFSLHGIVNAGFLLFGIGAVGTLVFGRFFCGWGCHLVALQDLCRWLLLRMGLRPIPLRSRALALVPLFAFAYMFLVPWVSRLFRGHRVGVEAVHVTTTSFWRTFPSWPVAVLTFLVCGFAIVYLLGAKGFCTYACPYGALFGLADRFAPGRIRVTNACDACAHCTAACTSNVRVHTEVRDFGMVVDPGCMKCLDCVSVCPKNALFYGFGRPSWLRNRGAVASKGKARAGLSWAEEGVVAVAFLAGFFAFRGLYGVVPFLFALGLGAALAFLSLQLVRLAYRPNVALLGWPLRVGGRVGRGGHLFVAAMIPVLAFWGHSGTVRILDRRAERAYASASAAGTFGEGELASAPVLSPQDEASARTALERATEAARWSLLPDAENGLRRIWLLAFLGRFEEADSEEAALLDAGLGGPRLRAGVRFELGTFHLARGQADRALALFRETVRIDPEWGAAYVNIGRILAREGRLDDARVAFAAAIRAAPFAAEARFHAGVVEAMDGRFEEAVARFREATEIRADYPEALHNLTGSLLQLGRYREAIASGERSAALHPRDPQTRLLLALACEASGEAERASEEIRAALALAPNSSEIRGAAKRILGDTADH